MFAFLKVFKMYNWDFSMIYLIRIYINIFLSFSFSSNKII